MDAAFRDRYRLERELGRGGMAVVYLAHDLRHDRPVALKILDPGLAPALGSERFLREIRVTARLQHPHILPLLDSGVLTTTQGQSAPYFVMPYVEGESLRGRLSREPQLPVDEAVRLAGNVASALAYAHGRGIVHRDIKPENILISNRQAMVADFGIAWAASLAGGERLTGTGLALGTPYYMSPEQATAAREVDGRTDVYALGCVLYEMLAGEPPFTGPTAQAVVARSLTEPPPPIRNVRGTVSPGLEQVIIRALAKAPADRYAGAEEFAEALSRAAAPAPAIDTGSRRWALPAAAVVVLLVAGALLLRGRAASSGLIAPASSLAVLPFLPSGPDSALSRLGRDLVFTLSATLDGLGEIRVVDPHTVLARVPREGFTTASEGAGLARGFGAGSVVQGSLVRVGADVRIDLALLGTDSLGTALARATVTAPPDSLAALTDSAARALLAQVWSRGSPPTPSLDGALRTSSVPALRAFLEGEQEITRNRWEQAAGAYERAMIADPGFWLAYARHVFARQWSLYEVADTVVAALAEHRFELPDRERLTIEAIVLAARDSLGKSLDRARAAGVGYPDSWFGWLLFGDAALHFGPMLGIPQDEARAALERAVELNPNLIPGWEHLAMVALLTGDSAAAARAIGSLERLEAGPQLSADGYGNRILQFRFIHAIQRGDRARVAALTDSIARDAVTAANGGSSFYEPFRYGFFPEQIAVSRAALAAGVSADQRLLHRTLLAISWAGRGAWDSALAGFDRLADDGADPAAPLRAYGVATLAAWLGTIESGQARARRPAAVRAARAVGPGATAELAWLDGVLAAASRQRGPLAAARARLRASGDSGRMLLDRSLLALDTALQGDTRAAGQAMAALEWEQAAVSASGLTEPPLATPLNRMAAGRWLAASGELEHAGRMLGWADGVFGLRSSTLYIFLVSGLADLERARIEERRGRPELSRVYYRRFLRRYDRPGSRLLPLVKEARDRTNAAASARVPVAPAAPPGGAPPAVRDTAGRVQRE